MTKEFDPFVQTDLIPRHSIPGMVAAWNQSVGEIQAAFALLNQAQERLTTTFGSPTSGFQSRMDILGDRNQREAIDLTKPETVTKHVQNSIWYALVGRLELRRVMSTKRAKEMDDQLRAGNMPEITEENLNGMLLGMLDQVGQFMDEAIKETLDWLIPCRSRYVSNSSFIIGKKVVKEYAVTPGYGGKWRVYYGREDNIRGLDNVFHMLDGKGSVPSYQGPLRDAIEKTLLNDNECETDYFKCRLFKNNNLHIEFKRKDLVDLLNQKAAKLWLADPDKRRMV